MVKLIIVLNLLLVSTLGLYGQQAGNDYVSRRMDFINATEINWYGVDYTFVKCIGSGFNNPDDIVKIKFNLLNNLVHAENKKYNISGALKGKKINYLLEPIYYENLKVNPFDMLAPPADGNYAIEQSVIEGQVKKYPIKETEGIGMIIIVESLVKITNVSKMHMVVFDVKTREIIHSHYDFGVATGFGFANFWGNPIAEFIEKYGQSYRSLVKQEKKKLKN